MCQFNNRLRLRSFGLAYGVIHLIPYDAHQSELILFAYAALLGVLRRFHLLKVAFKKGKWL